MDAKITTRPNQPPSLTRDRPPPGMLPEVRAAASIQKLAGAAAGDLSEMLAALRAQIARVRSGDMSDAEAKLVSQAEVLDATFHVLMSRAGAHLEHNQLGLAEQAMRLAFKAQSQARDTIRALGELRRPPSMRIEQANIANGPQQVNNSAD